MPVVLSTADVPPAERAAFWQAAVTDTFVPMDVTLLEEFPAPATITGHALGDLRVARVHAGPQRMERGPGAIARGGADRLALTLQHHGTARMAHEDRLVELRPGTFAVTDVGLPCTAEFPEEFAFTVFHWPRAASGLSEEELEALTANEFETGNGTTRLVATYLEHLAGAAGSLTPQTEYRLAATVFDLLGALAQERRGRPLRDPSEAASAALARVKDHILSHLGDPDLSPEQIAVANHISVRYLHKLFHTEEMTVGRWIRRRRLELCRRALAVPGQGRDTVATVAGRWGFASASHFSRAFRATYGITPRDWQAYAAAGSVPDAAARNPEREVPPPAPGAVA
ncbi:helix-turn-helix domain-containing protein [Streptomyces sp. NPDC048717]|uniref:helix-turn-helix domain-containing protein n=1 Tax=Streptomyces sp. NPDC048717 TaxID=3154928 RepID=UPI00341E9227